MEGTILDHSRRGGADHGKRTRSDGVRHGKCRGGEQSRLRCVFGYLLVAGTQKDGPHRARQGKRKVLENETCRSLFFRRTVSQKLRLIRIINEL